MRHILLTGGGTGGHIYPLIAVAEELKKTGEGRGADMDIRYFGAPYDFEEILADAGIRVSQIFTGKWRRYFDPRNLTDIFKLIFGFLQALWKIYWFMPDVCFSKGGTGSLPVALVCRFYLVPIVIHESDSIPGVSNRICGRWAKKIFISFESAAEYFPRGKTILVGNPIRPQFLNRELDGPTAKKSLGLLSGKPLLLFIGGSQGAARINDFVLDNLPNLLRDFEILHQTGIKNFEEVKKEAELILNNLAPSLKGHYHAEPYFGKNLIDALTAADIVVSRSGSGSIFELAALGKPSILIPLPEAASDHQRKNGYEYAKTGAAIVMETDNLTPNVFINEVKKIVSNPEKLAAMSAAALKFSRPEAAKSIAEEIFKI